MTTFAELCDLADVRGWKVCITSPPLRRLRVVEQVITPERIARARMLDRVIECSLKRLSLDEAAGRIHETMRELGAIK